MDASLMIEPHRMFLINMEMGLDELINVRTNPNLFSQNSQGCQVDRLISGHADGRIILFRFVNCGCFPGRDL